MSAETVILGLDPGSRFTGYGVIVGRGSRLRLVGQGRISLPSDRPLVQRLGILTQELERLLERFNPEVAVLESLFRGVNVRSLIVLAQARGALLATLATAELEIREYSPSEIKSAVTGDGRADKQQVTKMVKMILGFRNELTTDAADALAAAICCSQRAGIERLGAGNRPGERDVKR